MFRLDHGQIHVWHLPWRAIAHHAARSEAVLSSSELRKARSFRRSEDREIYLARHSAIRCILGRYCATSPHRIDISLGPFGKPHLGPQGPCFNLSHRAQYAVLALCIEAIGIDIELIRNMKDYEALAQTICTIPERAKLKRIAEQDRQRHLCELWTKKEAAFKAEGTGLQREPASVDVGWRDTVLLGNQTWHFHHVPDLPDAFDGRIASPLSRPHVISLHSTGEL